VRQSIWRLIAAAALLTCALNAAVAQSVDGRWAVGRYACDGEGATRLEAPLLVAGLVLGWFTSICTVVSSYKVKEAHFLQARCWTEGKVGEIPVMLEPRGERLRVGWGKEPIVELQRCPKTLP
jgi:hypothetical protein